MESFPPYPIGPGQRALAAIVFTDVVSFSARMQENEETTLRLLERDFAVMRKICDKYSGSVLKTTGDGLLLYFSSAVQAVAYALRMQKYFAEKTKTLPAAEMLTHRVGIHLGDVFVNDQDVMGDGVNIAARLQAEAEPGGICISQTVYDVVKNKLALQVTRLGPRELKNISQAIPVYRILVQAQILKVPGSGSSQEDSAVPTLPPPPPPPPSPSPTDQSRPFTRAQRLAAIGVLGLALVIAAGLVLQSHFRQGQDQGKAATTRTAISTLLETDPAVDGASREKLAHALANWRDELRDSRSRAPAEYNFAELALSLRTAKPGPIAKTDAPMCQQALERMQALFDWMGTAMQNYNRANPLIVAELSGTAPKEIRVFAGADHRLYFAEGGAVRQRGWADVKPSTLGAIIAAALWESATTPPREIVQGAQAFAYFYGLPEMNDALRQGRLPGGPK